MKAWNCAWLASLEALLGAARGWRVSPRETAFLPVCAPRCARVANDSTGICPRTAEKSGTPGTNAPGTRLNERCNRSLRPGIARGSEPPLPPRAWAAVASNRRLMGSTLAYNTWQQKPVLQQLEIRRAGESWQAKTVEVSGEYRFFHLRYWVSIVGYHGEYDWCE